MEKKEKLEAQFHELVKAHKSTIYSVCYMFSSDPDEVNDLFQDSLIKIWWAPMPGKAASRPGCGASP